MSNKQPNKTPMPEQAPEVRAKNFDEVALGYTPAEAVNEAKRCLQCKHHPCTEGCPVNVNIPGFIKHIAEEDFDNALKTIRADNTLPAICGRVCPQERQCERLCVRARGGEPVAVGRLERFAADNGHAVNEIKQNTVKKRVAVIGSGPAGLTCTGELINNGCDVTIFEALHAPGGVLSYGIPEFRLPKEIVRREVKNLTDLGAVLETDTVIGRTITIDELFEQGYDDVFIAAGAGLPSFMNIPGENLIGVYSANEFLTRINLLHAYREDGETPVLSIKNAVVIGGGNVAMDAARCALRLGAESVTVVYRRGEEELPARLEEIHHAKEEGIIFKFLSAPVEIIGNDDFRVKALVCEEMTLGEPDASGRRRPVPKTDSRFTVDCDCVISAIGTSPNPLLRQTTPSLAFDKYGCVVTDEETGKTNRPHVYAGGDISTGAATVILAMGAGKKAARTILES